jgi:hypothetical protein
MKAKVVICDDEMKLGTSGRKVMPISCAVYCPKCRDVLAHGPMQNESLEAHGKLYEFKNPLRVHSCGKRVMQIGVSSEEYRAWDAKRKFIQSPSLSVPLSDHEKL